MTVNSTLLGQANSLLDGDYPFEGCGGQTEKLISALTKIVTDLERIGRLLVATKKTLSRMNPVRAKKAPPLFMHNFRRASSRDYTEEKIRVMHRRIQMVIEHLERSREEKSAAAAALSRSPLLVSR